MQLKPYMIVALDGRIVETISMPTPDRSIMVREPGDPRTMIEVPTRRLSEATQAQQLRGQLMADGWVEQDSGTGLEGKGPLWRYSRMTWWNREDDMLLLVEDEWTADGGGDSYPTHAFVARESEYPLEVPRG